MQKNLRHLQSRRKFMRQAGILGTGALMAGMGLPAGLQAKPFAVADKKKKQAPMIGIQTGVGVLAKMGIGPFLDDIQQRAHVNTLFLFSFTYIPKRTDLPVPNFKGGNFAKINPVYYKNVNIKPEFLRAPDFGDRDFIGELIPEARRRGMKIFPWVLEDSTRPQYIPGMDSLYEIDLYGRRAERHPAGPCYNNPYYQNLMLGLLEDYTRSYDIDGIMWGAERQGPLSNALGAYHNGITSDPGKVTCFCEHCQRKGKAQGINLDRVIKGFKMLETYVRQGRKGQRPTDGYYVEFWRLLLQYPEILAWQTFWTTSMRAFQKALYTKVKSIRKEVQVGFHIWHNTSFNPIFRAEQDYSLYTPFADYIKPVLYSNSAGARMSEYLDSTVQNINGDLTKELALQLEYRLLNYNENPYERLTTSGFSSQYVFRETARAHEALKDSTTLLWPGIGIDEPSVSGPSKPDWVRKDVLSAFEAGADGVLLSRYYGEMKPENLSSAGEAIRSLGLI